MNKYKVLSLAFLLTFSIFTNAQQNKSASSDKGEIVMTKDELKSFLKMVAEKRIEQIKKMESKNSIKKVYIQAAPHNNYQGYRQEGGEDLRRQIEKVNTRLDNLMLALIAGKGTNTVVSSGTRPNDYIVNSDNNTSDQISNLERKLDSLKSVQYSTNLAPTNNVVEEEELVTVTKCGLEKPTKKCCAKKSEITPERRSVLEELLTKFKNFKRQVFFANNSYSVSQEDMKYLNRVTKVLKKNPELSVVLVGYASSVGSPEYNKQLSMKRAEAIAQALVEKGISKSRIIPAFYGEDHSTTDAKARRVDMTVVIK